MSDPNVSQLYKINHLSLQTSWVLNTICALVVLIYNDSSLTWSKVIILDWIARLIYRVTITSYPSKTFSKKEIIEFVMDCLELKNLRLYYKSNQFYFSNHFSISTRVLVSILCSQYFLFYSKEILHIDNIIIRLFVIITIIITFAQAAALQCLLFSNVNDLLFSQNVGIQIPILMIQSISLLCLESYLFLSSHVMLVLFIKCICLIFLVLYRKYYNLEIFEESRNQSLVIAYIHLLSIPYNYLPFHNFFWLKSVYCVRDRQQFSQEFLKIGRLAQICLNLIFTSIAYRDYYYSQQSHLSSRLQTPKFQDCPKKYYYSQCISQDHQLSYAETFILFFGVIMNGLIILVYLLDTLYRCFSNNYVFFSKKVITITQLISIIKSSKRLRYLNVSYIQGINYSQGQAIVSQNIIRSNFDDLMTNDQKQILFQLLFKPEKPRIDYKVLISQFIQIHQHTSAYFSPLFSNMMIDALQNQEDFPNRYFILIALIDNTSSFKFFQAILIRLFKFGDSKTIPMQIKQHRNWNQMYQILQQYRSAFLSMFVANQLILPMLSLNPSQILYDLQEEIK